MMEEKIRYYLKNLEDSNNVAIAKGVINDIQSKLDFKLPDGYLYVVEHYNGSEGEVGKGYLILFPFEELIETNTDYEYLMKDIPEYYLFGKDAADTGFAFHKQNHTYHSFGLLSNFETDPIAFWGNNFVDFLDHLISW